MSGLYDRFYVPEDVGISSMSLAGLLQECEKIHYKLRTLLVIRHGKPVAEVARYPFRAFDKRLVYSVSKTFTSTAVGVAVQEGLLRVDDTVLDYFPECRNLEIDERARRITIRNLLMMCTGHGVDTVGEMCNSDAPWPETFFTRTIKYEPGTHFVYDSAGTYMLSEIISRVTGMCLKDWLQTKVFDLLGITDVSWDQHGCVNTGAWGLLIAPRDLAKLGMLYLNKGVYEGRRILSEAWVEQATAPLIATGIDQGTGWSRHYGFQIWESCPGSFRADGAFGQFCMVFPEKDLVIVTTAEEMEPSRLFPLIETYILNAMTDGARGRDAAGFQYLKETMGRWETPAVYPPSSSYLTDVLQDRIYQLQGRTTQEKHSLRFRVGNSRLDVIVDEVQVIESSCVTDLFGKTGYVIEIPSCSPILGEEQKGRCWQYAAHHAWVDQDLLLLTICWQETGHEQTWKLQFNTDGLTLVVTDGLKGMFEFVGAVSDRNVRFQDFVFDGIVENR